MGLQTTTKTSTLLFSQVLETLAMCIRNFKILIFQFSSLVLSCSIKKYKQGGPQLSHLPTLTNEQLRVLKRTGVDVVRVISVF